MQAEMVGTSVVSGEQFHFGFGFGFRATAKIISVSVSVSGVSKKQFRFRFRFQASAENDFGFGFGRVSGAFQAYDYFSMKSFIVICMCVVRWLDDDLWPEP